MKKKTLTTFLFCFFYCLSHSQNIGDTLLIEGYIDNHFHLSSTHRLQAESRKEWEDSIKSFSKHLPEIDQYLTKLNNGDTSEANRYKSNNKMVSKIHSFEGTYYYTMAKMEEFGMLWKPMVQCSYFYDSTGFHLISCSEEELAQMEENMHQGKLLIMKIVCIGYWPSDQTYAYRLVAILKE